jgi:hypothetical protein
MRGDRAPWPPWRREQGPPPSFSSSAATGATPIVCYGCAARSASPTALLSELVGSTLRDLFRLKQPARARTGCCWLRCHGEHTLGLYGAAQHSPRSGSRPPCSAPAPPGGDPRRPGSARARFDRNSAHRAGQRHGSTALIGRRHARARSVVWLGLGRPTCAPRCWRGRPPGEGERQEFVRPRGAAGGVPAAAPATGMNLARDRAASLRYAGAASTAAPGERGSSSAAASADTQ